MTGAQMDGKSPSALAFIAIPWVPLHREVLFFLFNLRRILNYSLPADLGNLSRSRMWSKLFASVERSKRQADQTMNKRTESTKGHIQKKVLIQAPPAQIFGALTDARDLARWFCDRASSDPREGGELSAYWKSGKTGIKGRARYVKIEPNSFIELVWIDDGQNLPPENPTHILSYTLRSRRGTCEVSMSDRDESTLDEDALARLDSGWNSVLLELKDYCERKARAGKGRPSED